jgi:hypothetical protein
MTGVELYQPGQSVAIIQQIPLHSGTWTTRTQGAILRYEQCKTGAAFARAKDDRLWLDRLIVRRDDGEVTAYVLDQYTRVEPLAAPATNERGTLSGPIPAAAVSGTA